MTVIRAAFPIYYKEKSEIEEAINVWAEMFSDANPKHVAHAVKYFIMNDTSGFPPTIGQIRSIARELMLTELEKKRREQESLPEPEMSAELMPDYIREQLSAMFKFRKENINDN